MQEPSSTAAPATHATPPASPAPAAVPTPQRCSECGWIEATPPHRLHGFWWPWRWIPTLIVLAGIATLLYAGMQPSNAGQQRLPGTSPSMLPEAITRVEVQAIAAGKADDATLRRFRGAISRFCNARLPFTQSRERMVAMGFFPRLTSHREDESIGWPSPWWWRSCSWRCDDAFTFKPPPDRPAIQWPGAGWTLERAGAMVNIHGPPGAGEWRLTPEEFRYWALPSELNEAFFPANAGVLALAFAVALVVTSAIVRRAAPAWRWRRRAASFASGCAVIIGLIGAAALARKTASVPTGSWTPTAASESGWYGLDLLKENAEEVLAALEDDTRTRALAEEIVGHKAAVLDERRIYLAAAVGPTWERVMNSSGSLYSFTVFMILDTSTRTTIPSRIAALPPDEGWRFFVRSGELVLTRINDAGMHAVSVRLAIGHACWILTLLIAAWCVPAAIVRAWRARRLRPGHCRRCGYALADATAAAARRRRLVQRLARDEGEEEHRRELSPAQTCACSRV